MISGNITIYQFDIKAFTCIEFIMGLVDENAAIKATDKIS